MLGLTACGEAEKSDDKTEKTVETTTVEETTVEESAEEEATDAVTTEIVTAEEVTTEAAAEAGFKPVEGLSDRYADTHTMGFSYNGQVFRLGEATVQDLLNAGIEMESKDLDDEKIASYDDVSVKISLNDSAKLSLKFEPNNGANSVPPAECVLRSLKLTCEKNVEVGDHTVKVDINGMKEDDQIQFGFPLDLKPEELVANSGEPEETKVAGALQMTSYYYRGSSLLCPDKDDYITECRFIFDGETLYSYSADCNKQDRDKDDD